MRIVATCAATRRRRVTVAVRFNATAARTTTTRGSRGTRRRPQLAEAFGATSIGPGTSPGASAPASVFGLLIIELPNYGTRRGTRWRTSRRRDKRGTASGSLVVRALRTWLLAVERGDQPHHGLAVVGQLGRVACLRLCDGFVMGLPLGGKPEPTPVTDATRSRRSRPTRLSGWRSTCATGAYRYIALSPPELKQRADDQAQRGGARRRSGADRRLTRGTRSPRSSRPGKQPTRGSAGARGAAPVTVNVTEILFFVLAHLRRRWKGHAILWTIVALQGVRHAGRRGRFGAGRVRRQARASPARRCSRRSRSVGRARRRPIVTETPPTAAIDRS
jgi:hypothetical protein